MQANSVQPTTRNFEHEQVGSSVTQYIWIGGDAYTAVAVAKKTGTGSWVVYHIFSTWAPVYSLSKTTMNAITLQLAAALQPGGIAVNAMCPGWVKTDMGGSGASRSVAKGVETAVWLATEAAQNLTGKFFRDKKEISW